MSTRDTAIDRLMHNARTRGARTALRFRRDGQWQSLDWATYYDRARAFAGALIAEGCQPGEAVAIMGGNSVEWLVADVGAMCARAVPAGIYQTCSGEQAAYVAGHCDARVLVLESRAYWDRIAPERAKLPALQRVVLMQGEPGDGVDAELVVTFDAFLAKGRGRRDEVDQRIRELTAAELATLIYTSGTTGPPKGVMLSHANLAWTAKTAAAVNDTTENDVGVSYLPLSHIAEQMTAIHIPLAVGSEVWIAESLDKLRDTLLAARPTVLLAVPRVWEKFRAALEPRLDAARGAQGAVVRWARAVGARAGHARIERGAVTGLLAVEERLAQRLFFAKLAKQLGLDRLRVPVSGAAPIGRDVLEFFLSCGIQIQEVYGQSEGTGVASYNLNRPGKIRLGTVGPPLPGATVKIAEDGEIVVQSPGNFIGYYKDPEATRATLVDGWLHTGDVGEFDAQGFLRITDRKKDLIITSGGKNIAPQNVEALLRTIEGVAQALVIGDRRNYLTALLTLDPEKATALAAARGWPTDRAQLVAHPELIAHVQRELDRINRALSRVETVRRFTLLAEDFTIESGELTPTMKVKRKVVHERHASKIEAMYAQPAGDADGARAS